MIKYRYHCSTTNKLVWEQRSEDDPAPVVCKEEGGPITPNTLTIIGRPKEVKDLVIKNKANFTTSSVQNLNHSQLGNVGTHSHAVLDSHVDDADKHRVINDSSTTSTDLWSASKISSELAAKATSSHTHIASDITDLTSTITNHGDVSSNTTHRSRTDNPHSVTKAQVGLSTVENLKVNLLGLNDPTANDDVSSGYSIGSRWFNITGKKEFSCVDNSAGSAIWRECTVEIKDASTALNSTWSSSKISGELSSKASSSHTHIASEITDFTSAVANNTNVSDNTAHRGLTDNPHNITKSHVGLSNVENKLNNFLGLLDPSVSDDASDGYSLGSTWYNTSSKQGFACLDSTVGAAVWRKTTLEIDDSTSSSTGAWSSDKVNATFSVLGHTHTASEITDFTSSVDSRITSQKAQVNGLATLDGNGKVPTAQLPDFTIGGSVTVVADITARDALSPTEGDISKVTDSDGQGTPETYIYDGSNWVLLQSSDVASINGLTGAVTIDTDNINEGSSNLYYTDARAAAHTDVAANTTHRSRTDNPHNVTIDHVTTGLTGLGKGDLIGHDGVSHVTLQVGNNGEILEADSTADAGFKWVTNPKFYAHGDSESFFNVGIWVTVDRFIYPGGVIDPAKVSKILVDAYTDDASSSFDIRVVDVTSAGAPTVAIATNNVNTSPAIVDLNGQALSVPSIHGIIEVQIKKNSGVDSIYINYDSTLIIYN